MKKIKKSGFGILGIIAILQIILLINTIPSESFALNQDYANENVVSNKNNFKKIFDFGINLLVSFLTIKQIQGVSAQTEGLRCCPVAQVFDSDGTQIGIAYDQDLTQEQIDNGECIVGDPSGFIGATDDTPNGIPPLSVSCENSALHNPQGGTCVFDEGISCVVSSEFACEQETDDVEWIENTPAQIQQCQKGCCIVGSNAHFETDAQCQLESGNFLPSVNTEAACIILSENLLQGACVKDGGCDLTTLSDCTTMSGDFFPSVLCTNPGLEDFDVDCIPTQETMIVDDKIYWTDSCENQGNIYDSSKVFDGEFDELNNPNSDDSYWAVVNTPVDADNDGTTDNPMCSVYNDDGTIDESALESCGLCDRFAGTMATSASDAGVTPDYGDFACKDLSCSEARLGIDFTGDGYTNDEKKNGDKWCVYESTIGEVIVSQDRFASDTVGSEYWLMNCINGEVDATDHSSYRENVCQENDVTESATQASMTGNAAPVCFSYNPLINGDGEVIGANIDECNANPHCMVKNVSVDDYFRFSVCTPRYPTGFDDETAAQSYCAVANTECTVIYQKNENALLFEESDDVWECIENCDCQHEEFAREMNNLCISLGDCGSYINYAGKGTNNVEINGKRGDKSGKMPKNIPDVYDWSKYGGYESVVPEKYIAPPSPEVTEEDIGNVNTGEEISVDDIGDTSIFGDLTSEETAQFILTLGGILTSPTLQDVSGENLFNVLGGGGSIVWGLMELGWVSSASTPMSVSTITDIKFIFSPDRVGYGGETIQGGYSTAEVTSETTYYPSTSYTPFAAAAVGAVIGAYIGASVAQQLDITGPAATILILAGGTSGGTLAYAYYAAGANPVAVGFGWGAVAVVVWVAASGYGQTEERKIQFTCLPWQAPTGTTSEDCAKCNENPLLECTQYRCESLGQTCTLINEGTDEPICESIEYEPNPPVITAGESKTEGYTIINKTGAPIGEAAQLLSVSPGGNGCIEEYQSVQFTLNTDEFAQCKWSYTTDNFEEMSVLDSGNFEKIHNLDTGVLSWNLLDAYEVTGDIITGLQGEVELHVKCRDVHSEEGGLSNINPNPYIVNFCMKQGPDETPVLLDDSVIINPENNEVLPYGTENTPFSIFINEPAECKYDFTDIGYDEMLNSLTCDLGLSTSAEYPSRWKCETPVDSNLPLAEETTTIYIRCRDQPWLSTDTDATNDNLRNTNIESYVYTLQRTQTQLIVDSISLLFGDNTVILNPSDYQEIRGGGDNFMVDLIARTSGGSENGEAECSYDFVESPIAYSGDIFQQTLATTHTQEELNLFGGCTNGCNYNISVSCNDDFDEDGIGNFAEEYGGTFNLFVDSQSPKIVRVFKEGGRLKLITNEEAKCSYGLQASFCSDGTVDSGNSMETGFDTIHSTNWDSGSTYYIKCIDFYGNENTGCARTVIPDLEVR